LLKTPDCKKYIPYSEKFLGHPLFFRASAGYSKLLNNKKYMFNTVKNIRATLFFKASAICSKLLNVYRLFNTVKIPGQL